MLGTQSLIMLDLQKILPMDFKAEFIRFPSWCTLILIGDLLRESHGRKIHQL